MKDITLIGIGFAGCKILSKVEFDAKKIFIDTDKENIEKYPGLLIGKKVCNGLSAGLRPEKGELAVMESKNEILELIGEAQNIIIIAPQGGGNSCGSSKRLIEILVEQGKSVKLLTSVPFEIEGSIRTHNAVSAINFIENICEIAKVKRFDISNSTKECHSLEDIFNAQDELYLEKLAKLLNN